MLELAVLIFSVGSVVTNYYLIKNIKSWEVYIPAQQIFVEIVEKPAVELSTQVPLPSLPPTAKDNSKAWKNGKVETEPVKVGWRPKNNPPPPPGPMERPTGFSR